MQKLDSSLLCMEIISIAHGYRALNAATSDGRARVLEASPVGSGFLILMSGSERDLRGSLERVRALFDGASPGLLVDAELISSVADGVKESLFALSETRIGETLVVVETETVSGCLHLAQALVGEHGLLPIEVRIQRSSSGGAYGFFTGTGALAGPAVVDARAKLEASVRTGRAELIESPTPVLRSYFQISGET